MKFLKQNWLQLSLFAVLCVAGFYLIVIMVSSAIFTRNSYTTPNEPKNAYMVHVLERGLHQEQTMCSTAGDCVILRTPGMHNYEVASIEIGGVIYESSINAIATFIPVASGVYCPGQVDMMSCFEVVEITKGQTCPESVIYLGFKAPLYPETCILSDVK